MLLAPDAKATFAPATSDTLDEDALSEKFVAVGTVGPTIVIELAPELNVILAPATRLTLDEVPFKKKLVAAGTAGPITVTEGFVESCDNVIFGPATRANAEEEAVFAVPLVAPPAVEAIDTRVE